MSEGHVFKNKQAMKNILLLLVLLPLMACNSKVYELDTLPRAKPTALIFLSAECPISQKYIQQINQLSVDYPQVQFYGVFPIQESKYTFRKFKRSHKLNFPLIYDHQNRLAHQLGATHTPEAFLISCDKKVLYRGAIDNWYYDLEQIPAAPTDLFLKNAVERHLQDQPIFLKDTRPIGCLIEQ